MPPPQTNGVVIEVRENGPYLVRNLERLLNSRGESIATRDVIALCRCGGSANRPFCDKTHASNGFSGENQSDGSKDRRVAYVGKNVTVHDNRSICSHAGLCTDSLASVFRSKAKPWIDPDGAEASAVIEAVRRCPSGALSSSTGGVEERDDSPEPIITVSKDGPYYVTGGIQLAGASWDAEGPRERYALCRCGGSRNKPFCDGTHWSIGFTDDRN